MTANLTMLATRESAPPSAIGRKPRISFCENAGGVVTDLRDFLMEFMREKGRDVSMLKPHGRLDDIGDILFSVNFIPDVARLAARLRKPYIAWISSSWLNPELNDPTCVSDWTVMFHCTRSDMEKCRHLGYRHIFFLPRSIDLRPFLKPAHHETRPIYNLSFVGNCYAPGKTAFHEYRTACRAKGIPAEQGLADLEAFLEHSLRDLTTPLRQLFTETVLTRNLFFPQQVPLPDRTMASHQDRLLDYMVDHLMSHEIDLRMRRRFIQELAPAGLHLWGDAQGWQPTPDPSVVFHGPARRDEMPAIALQSRICLNLPRRFTDGINFRLYEIPACGGFQMTLWGEDQATMFDPDLEIVFFRSLEEAKDKCRFYLDHDSSRLRIATAGQKRLLKDHTMENRFGDLCRILKTIGIEL